MKKAAIYCRVSTEDQDCNRQLRDLNDFAARAGFMIVAEFSETESGLKDNRTQRCKALKLAQAREIEAILVTEMTRWGRSTSDLLTTLTTLDSYNVSLVAITGFQFDRTSPQGKLLSTILAALSEFERDIIAERTKSGLAAAKAKGRVLGRPPGNRSIPRHRKKVLQFLAEGKTYRWIAAEMHIGRQTVMDIAKQSTT